MCSCFAILTKLCSQVTRQAFLKGEGARAAFVTGGGKTVECADMAVAQKVIFALGWGPVPYFRRPGVAVLIHGYNQVQIVGCIVRHEDGNYLSVSHHQYKIFTAQGVCFCSPREVTNRVVPVGTKLLVRCDSAVCERFVGRLGPLMGVKNTNEVSLVEKEHAPRDVDADFSDAEGNGADKVSQLFLPDDVQI
jgi:hypothetical protein